MVGRANDTHQQGVDGGRERKETWDGGAPAISTSLISVMPYLLAPTSWS